MIHAWELAITELLLPIILGTLGGMLGNKISGRRLGHIFMFLGIAIGFVWAEWSIITAAKHGWIIK